ncbi:hypothetical protein EEB13_30530 [Rhodococcus sp. WS3]|nr:hypothetical protein EEB13_30530 [Rhodococcus sp. WS3]
MRTLRAALDRAGLARVGLITAPPAALAWLESEHGSVTDGFVLVYDASADGLDASALDVVLVTGAPPLPGWRNTSSAWIFR